MTSIYNCAPSKRSMSAGGGGAGGSSGTGGGGGGGPGAWTLVGEEPQLGNPNWDCPKHKVCTGHMLGKYILTSMSSLSIYSSSTTSTAQQSTAQSPLHKAANQVRADQSTFIKPSMYVQHACGVRVVSWSMELFAFTGPLFAPKMLDHLLHVSFHSSL